MPYLPKKTDRGSKEQERQLEIAGERRDRSAVDAHSSPKRAPTLGEGRGQNRASLKWEASFQIRDAIIYSFPTLLIPDQPTISTTSDQINPFELVDLTKSIGRAGWEGVISGEKNR